MRETFTLKDGEKIVRETVFVVYTGDDGNAECSTLDGAAEYLHEYYYPRGTGTPEPLHVVGRVIRDARDNVVGHVEYR